MATAATLSRVAVSRIQVATDFSAQSRNALQYALSLARRYESKIFITHVIPSNLEFQSVEFPIPMHDMLWREAESNLGDLERNPDLASVRHEIILDFGNPGKALSKLASDGHMDLVVMGTHGREGSERLRLGSVAETVMRHVRCPVLTVGAHVKPPAMDRFGHILYATDFSSGSLHALTYALALSEEDGAELTMLHVIETTPSSNAELVNWEQAGREHLRRLIPEGVELAFAPEIEVEPGNPGQEIVRLAETREENLIVMGCRKGGTFSTHLPWSTLHYVVQHAPCPVLTVCAT